MDDNPNKPTTVQVYPATLDKIRALSAKFQRTNTGQVSYIVDAVYDCVFNGAPLPVELTAYINSAVPQGDASS